jgi:pyruvate/2-oxoglutarate dehydrogenase complex dihydrolipoamide acyltransferase (E2) component
MIKVTLDALAWKDVEPDVQALVDKWLVAAGDAVSAGQVLANVVVIKSSQDLLAPAAGVLESMWVAAGETFSQGQTLALLKESS